jgi:hypothetical protein
MALTTEQKFIAYAVNYDPNKGGIPESGSIYRNKRGTYRYYWVPSGGNYDAEEKFELTGWYDIPCLEDLEEWTFDSVCFTPSEDEVEPDHPDSWLRLLYLI